jgi:predicted nucleic acid-binding protein
LGLNRVRSFLRRHRRIALDTSIFIYQLQAHPRYVSFTNTIFEWLGQRGSQAVTSTITMVELLVHPYRTDNEPLADELYGLLSVYPNLEWIAPSLEIADLAARIRAEHGLRTPDALQAATVLHTRATGLITNDPIFERLQNLETLVLDQIL